MFGQESWPLKNILSPHLRPTVCLSEACEWKNGGEERMSDSEASTALIKKKILLAFYTVQPADNEHAILVTG